MAGMFKALSHPTRIFILNRLIEREHVVNELTEMIGVEASTVSRHLSVLKNVGIIEGRKEGSSIYYRIARDCVKKALECAEHEVK